MEDFKIESRLVGYLEGGDRVYVDVTYVNEDWEATTVEHEKVSRIGKLSITGEVYDEGKYREPHSAGQIHSELLSIVRPPKGRTLQDIQELYGLWQRWHLNDLRAACAHMPENAHKLWLDKQDVICEEGTGYKYGTSWLYEAVPDSVLKRIRQILR